MTSRENCLNYEFYIMLNINPHDERVKSDSVRYALAFIVKNLLGTAKRINRIGNLVIALESKNYPNKRYDSNVA